MFREECGLEQRVSGSLQSARENPIFVITLQLPASSPNSNILLIMIYNRL
jgi:hypothetical protein